MPREPRNDLLGMSDTPNDDLGRIEVSYTRAEQRGKDMQYELREPEPALGVALAMKHTPSRKRGSGMDDAPVAPRDSHARRLDVRDQQLLLRQSRFTGGLQNERQRR